MLQKSVAVPIIASDTIRFSVDGRGQTPSALSDPRVDSDSAKGNQRLGAKGGAVIARRQKSATTAYRPETESTRTGRFEDLQMLWRRQTD